MVEWTSGKVGVVQNEARGTIEKLMTQWPCAVPALPPGVVGKVDQDKREVGSYGPQRGLVRTVSAQRVVKWQHAIGDYGSGRGL